MIRISSGFCISILVMTRKGPERITHRSCATRPHIQNPYTERVQTPLGRVHTLRCSLMPKPEVKRKKFNLLLISKTTRGRAPTSQAPLVGAGHKLP
ncbi:hypothetical protein GDO81_019931 [Engystomops pustulosus]|uniref:Uncharacterized protein n=1 Tax=Engystomops pustulosus TaxID=76066 RepID=A0AAV6YXU7_ENGPU|nr:hypothetical protein GDO81_019931 [Engystomops pustulosus]